MGEVNAAKQIARWVALGALFLIPLTPLIVTGLFFFPFITGKAFFFRILVEVAVCAWVVLALLDRAYRPRFSYIGVVAVAFVLWMFVADAFALNATKAFWSNFERMEGWVLLVHLLGFFFAMSAVLRVEKKWRAWFLTSLGVSVVICGHALLQLAGSLPIHQGSTRIDASLGNSAYLAIYLLFNVCIALWLASTTTHAWLKRSLVALAALEGVLIFFTETRGTILGLVGALMLAALLTTITANARARRYAAGAFVLLVLLTGGFYAARDTDFVQHNRVLERVASISPEDGQTRFTIWRMAAKGVAERPVTGWGQEGFNYIFNTYYDPSLHAQEPWFDRAHNAFVDWLTAGGVPAFLLYIGLFASAVMALWRSSGLTRTERTFLTAAFAGYAVHNLFVFDNLYSYVYFFALLAFVDAHVARPVDRLEHAAELGDNDGVAFALPMAAVAVVALVWMVNITGMQAASRLITAISPSQKGLDQNIAVFETFAANPSFAAQEVREQLVSFASAVAQSSSATDEEKRRILTLAIEEMQKQVAAYPRDTREHLQLMTIYRAAGRTEDALSEAKAAALLSPTKEDVWVQKGALDWDKGDVQAARDDFHTAYTLGPTFTDLAAYAAAGDIAVGNVSAADKLLLSAFGTTSVDSDVLMVAYYRTKNWPRLIDLWKLRTSKPDASVETWFGLASAQYVAGEYANAVKTIQAVVALHPEAAESGAAAIAQIEGKAKSQ
ncbi:MAG: O-antigen ligase family protein [Candidatus Paceibacterota bacterium]|jgi:O-antigen ligase/Flp pilus assembly protein TadD